MATKKPVATRPLKKTTAVSGGNRGTSRSLPKPLIALFIVGLAVFGTYMLVRSNAQVPTTDEKRAANEVIVRKYTLQLVSDARRLQAKPGNAALIEEMRAIVAARKTALTELVTQSPDSVLKSQFPANLIGNLPADVQAQVETPVDLSGTLEVAHSDSYDETTQKFKDAKFYTWLTDKMGKRYSVHFSNEAAIEGLGGKVIRIKGVKVDDNVAVGASATDTQIVATGTVAAATTTKKIAVVLVNFSNDSSQPWTTAQIKNSVFAVSGSSDNMFYQENSYGKVGLGGQLAPDGDVFGWYTIADSSATSCDWSLWGQHAQSAAQAAGVSFTGYDSVVYMWPRTRVCGWAGLGYLPGGSAYIDGYGTDLRVVSHELGHNFGVHHASAYNCTDGANVRVSISTTCTSDEYGDPFDVMGSSLRHFNNYNKGRLGYYAAASNTQTVTASGSYTVAPIETSSGAVQALRVPKTYDSTGKPTSYYYVQANQSVGFDNYNGSSPVLSGATIRFAPDYTTITQSKLIDSTPATTTFDDSPFQVGSTFSDPASGVSITTQSVSTSGATVQVSLGASPCVRNNPTAGLSPYSQWGNAGDSLVYSLTITNTDSLACGTGAFSLSSAVQAGLTQTPASSTVNLAPGASVTLNFTVSTTAGVTPAYYSFTENVYNSAAPAYKASASGNYNVYAAVDSSAPAVNISAPLNNSTVGSKAITIAATATDNVSVTGMTIFIDGQSVQASTNGSITFNWQTRRITRGTHTIKVNATDAAGNIGTSTVTVVK